VRPAGPTRQPVRWTPQSAPSPSRDPPIAEPIAPIVLRIPTAADPATLWAALTVPERIAAWFAHGWHWLGAPASETTQVTWEVEPATDGRSAVVLRHAGWAEAGLGETDRDDHREAWQEYLDGLLELLSGEA
jgi:uncharacterized protein YndB with AHSA1/START domain